MSDIPRISPRIMAVLGIGWFGTNFFWGFVSGSLPLFLKSFTDSKFKISVALSLAGVAGCIIPPVVGFLSDRTSSRFGRRRPYIFFGMLGVFLGVLSLPHASTFGIVVLISLVFFFSISVVETPYMSLLPDITPPEQRSTASGALHLLGSIGMIAYFSISAEIWDSHRTAVFYMVAFLYLGTILTTVAIIKEPSTLRHEMPAWVSPADYVKDIVRETNALKLLVAQFFWWLGLLIVSPFATLFTAEELGASEGKAHLVLVSFSVATTIFALPFGMLGDRFGRKGIMTCSIAFWVVSEIIVGLSQTLTQAVIFVGLTGIPFAAAMGVGYAFLLDLVPEERTAEFVGFNIVSIAATQLVGPLIGGKLIDTLGYRSIFPVAATFMFVGLVVLQFVQPRGTRASTPSAT